MSLHVLCVHVFTSGACFGADSAVSGLSAEQEREKGILEDLNEQLRHWKEMELQATTKEQMALSVARQNEIQKEIGYYRALAAAMAALGNAGPKKAEPIAEKKGVERGDLITTGAGNRSFIPIKPLDEAVKKAGIVKKEFSDAAKAIIKDWNAWNVAIAASDQMLMALTDHAIMAVEEIGKAFSGAETDFKGLVNSMLGGISQILKGLLSQAIGGLIAGEAVKGIPGLIAGVAGIGFLKGMWDKHVNMFGGGEVPGGFNSDSYGPVFLRTGEKVIPPPKALDFVPNSPFGNGPLVLRLEDRGGVLHGLVEGQRRRHNDNF